MTSPDAESTLEKAMLELFQELDWQTVNAYHEVYAEGPNLGTEGPYLGRATRNEVVLCPRLEAALARLNPDLPSEALHEAVTELTRDRSAMSLVRANREVYTPLKEGVRVTLPDPGGEESFESVRFTATPLVIGEERTREVFGDYVSIYNFRQSVEDQATVPLYYENRVPEVQLTNEQLNEDMRRLLEDAELDDAQEAMLQREFAREYHIITRDDRLEKVAEDIVRHFVKRGCLGKAMVVSIDKLTTVRMYDKEQKHWQRTLDKLRMQAPTASEEERQALEARIAFMEETDMAVVISQEQGEVLKFREHGLDILPHRKRFMTEGLDEKFKDPDDPFRLVFVCAMWRTGFDVP